MAQQPKFVVAGVTGRVGSVVARELIARGTPPTVIVRDPVRAAEWSARGAVVATGLLEDESFLARTLDGVTGFFTLLPDNVSPQEYHATRRRMADAMAAAVAESGVPHAVVLSAIAAVLPDGNGPGKDLHYLENRLRTSGATVTALRACYFQDNVADALAPAMRMAIYPSFLPSPDMPIPMIATRDVGRFAAASLASPAPGSEVVDLLGPVYSVRQVAERLGSAIGRALQVVTVPPDQHVTTLVRAGVPPQLAEAVAEMFAAFAAGLLTPQGDRRLTGSTTIESVIAECLERHRAAEVGADVASC